MATQPLIPASFPQAPGPSSRGYLRGLDAIHRGIVSVDKVINRVIPEEFNPFYYLGGITNLLWVLLVPTGIFLWFYYTPTQSDAYGSVAYLTQRVPFGALIRGLHRYGGDGMFIMAILHLLRNFFTDRYRGFRDVPWVSGIILLLFTGFIGLTGYLLVWDQRALVITKAMISGLGSLDGVVNGLGAWFSRALLGGDTPNNLTLARMFFLHVGPAMAVFVLLWVHYLRLHRPKIWPPAFVTLLVLGVVFLISGVAPVETLAPASTPLAANASVPLDIFFLWPVSFLASMPASAVLTLIAVVSAALILLPWLPRRPRYINTATVTAENCTGCQLCAIDCPFDAIVMVPGENPNPRYKELAVVNDDKCAECGICVGACPFHAINLPLADENVIKEKVVALLQ